MVTQFDIDSISNSIDSTQENRQAIENNVKMPKFSIFDSKSLNLKIEIK